MLSPFIRRSLIKAWKTLGFTQIEILAIVFIIGIMATIAAPSFGGMLEAARMKQAAVELRSAFQETQRQSIRNNKSCTTSVVIPSRIGKAPLIKGSCLSSGDRSLPEGIGLATNLLPLQSSNSTSLPSDFNPLSTKVHRAGTVGDVLCSYQVSTECQAPARASKQASVKVGIEFGRLGAARFKIATEPENSTPPNYSAKFVTFRPSKIDAKKTCVVLSGSLGLTRLGTYTGELNPTSITSNGKCQVASWESQ